MIAAVIGTQLRASRLVKIEAPARSTKSAAGEKCRIVPETNHRLHAAYFYYRLRARGSRANKMARDFVPIAISPHFCHAFALRYLDIAISAAVTKN